MDDDRKTLEAVAKSYNELMALQIRQRETMALMLRACLQRLNSDDKKKRAEAIKGLTGLLEIMEAQNRG